ncbi:MAG: hypothetical protein OXN83_03200 [Oligoflexia bacterium]|nr:hypothetical protein [Oligoflexia bacterium]
MNKGFESEIFNSILSSLGEVCPLEIAFDDSLLKKQLKPYHDKWVPYNRSKPDYKRYGLSLFSLDGGISGVIDLNSLLEYNRKNQTDYSELSFRVPTCYWKELSSLSEPLKGIEKNLGRSHLIRLDNGGFFPPHRDLEGNTFRLIAFFNSEPDTLAFLLDDKKIYFLPNRLYFFNARRTHSLFSFKDNTILLVLNVEYSEDSINFVMENLLDK